MKTTRTTGIACCAIGLFAATLQGQDVPWDRVSVPLRDPSRPGSVEVNLKRGGITVKGYDGKEVVVEARVRKSREKAEDQGEGLKRIDIAATGLSVEEENNVVTIGTRASRPVDLAIQVPLRTSLNLSCRKDGDITVENVEGEIEVNNLDGAVLLTNVAGVVVAHSEEKMVVQLSKVTPDKPMSFSSMDGDVDVTLPAEIKANVKLEAEKGRFKSDFHIHLAPRTPTLEGDGKKGGKYRIVLKKGISGSINGGGPEISFKTVDGNLYIRRGAKEEK